MADQMFGVSASRVDVEACHSMEENETASERPCRRPNFRATMVWDGYMYSRERIGLKCSWWRCRKNRPQERATRKCYARGTFTYADQWFVVTVKHSHAPESTLQNYIPPSCQPKGDKDLEAAVKGFVLSSDQQLLQSKVSEVKKHHKCELCGMKFAISRVLETHKMLEHQMCAQWKCSECGMQFLEAESHDRHLYSSHPPPAADFTKASDVKTECREPKLEVLSDDERQDVEPLMNTEEPTMKEEVTESKASVKRKPGKSRRKDNQMHKCEHCPAQFRHPSKLKEHMRKHTGEKPYGCSLCPRTFISGSRRGAHFKSHFKVRNHLCDWCGKKFTKQKILVEHVRTHTGEKPYSCSECSRQFRKRNALMVHFRQHTGEKPYVCDQCGQSFTVRVSLRAHLKSKHNIIVKSDLPERQVQAGDASIPSIGRPKKTDAEKQLFANKPNGHMGRSSGHADVDSVTSHAADAMGDYSVLAMPTADAVASGALFSIPQF